MKLRSIRRFERETGDIGIRLYSCPCLCGEGTFAVDECWPSEDSVLRGITVWIGEIECERCAAMYFLRAGEYRLSVFRKRDMENAERLDEEWFAKEDELRQYAWRKGYYPRLLGYLASLPSKRAIHSAVGRFGHVRYDTFLRDFCTDGEDVADWLELHLFNVGFVDALDALVRVRDAELTRLGKEAAVLSARAEREPVAMKVIAWKSPPGPGERVPGC